MTLSASSKFMIVITGINILCGGHLAYEAITNPFARAYKGESQYVPISIDKHDDSLYSEKRMFISKDKVIQDTAQNKLIQQDIDIANNSALTKSTLWIDANNQVQLRVFDVNANLIKITEDSVYMLKRLSSDFYSIKLSDNTEFLSFIKRHPHLNTYQQIMTFRLISKNMELSPILQKNQIIKHIEPYLHEYEYESKWVPQLSKDIAPRYKNEVGSLRIIS